ncbi:MAG: BBE domain-containing protein [Casimicrobiaceae bacterium]
MSRPSGGRPGISGMAGSSESRFPALPSPRTAPGVPGPGPDQATASRAADASAPRRQHARDVRSGYCRVRVFGQDWRRAHWSPNYPGLEVVKSKYDSDELFYAHHGVGREEWGADGSTWFDPGS